MKTNAPNIFTTDCVLLFIIKWSNFLERRSFFLSRGNIKLVLGEYAGLIITGDHRSGDRVEFDSNRMIFVLSDQFDRMIFYVCVFDQTKSIVDQKKRSFVDQYVRTPKFIFNLTKWSIRGWGLYFFFYIFPTSKISTHFGSFFRKLPKTQNIHFFSKQIIDNFQ